MNANTKRLLTTAAVLIGTLAAIGLLSACWGPTEPNQFCTWRYTEYRTVAVIDTATKTLKAGPLVPVDSVCERNTQWWQ